MSESTSNEPESESSAEEQTVDLSALKSFSFGTQWTAVDKLSKGGQRSGGARRDGGDRRRGQSGATVKKDRRPQRPAKTGPGSSQGRGEGPHRHQDRRERPQGGGSHPQRREGGGHFRRGAPEIPYESDVFEVAFYPEDNGFSAIIKAMRTSHLTYELFEVARTFLVKFDRFIASVTRKPEKPGEKAPKVFISMPDNMPFASEDEALMHAATNNIEAFFDTEEIEVEPPSGSFSFVNRCPFTKTLLGPPNYHRYEEILKNHHRAKLADMPFEKLQSSIETVHEEEVVNEWLESMKKTTRYTTKAAEGEEAKSFGTFEDALVYLKTEQREKLVKTVNYARVNGAVLDKYKNTEAFRAVQGELKRQRKFPLETANAIRGRMRREKFSIYKKGSKGVTYVCAAKRNFRVPGQVMSPSLDRIIRFIEAHQNIKAKEFLVPYQEWLKENEPEVAYDEKQAQADLHWLIADGYVSHFGDDSLFAQPVMDNAPKKKASPPAPKSEEPAKSPTDAAPAEPKAASESATVEEAPAPESTAAEVSAEETPTAEGTSSAESEPVESPEAEPPTIEEAKVEAVSEKPAVDQSEVEVAAEEISPEALAKEPKETEASGEAAVVKETEVVEEAPSAESTPVESPEVEPPTIEEEKVEAVAEIPAADQSEVEVAAEEISPEPPAKEPKETEASGEASVVEETEVVQEAPSEETPADKAPEAKESEPAADETSGVAEPEEEEQKSAT